jgi:hypothetical protein
MLCMGSGVEYHGPFVGRSDVVIDGWKVPFLDGRELDGGQISFVLDQRLAFQFEVAIADEVARFVADAIAVALGYGSHPRVGLSTEEYIERFKATGVHQALLPKRVHEIVAAERGDACG